MMKYDYFVDEPFESQYNLRIYTEWLIDDTERQEPRNFWYATT